MKRFFTVLFAIYCLFAANAVFSEEINVQAGLPDALFNAVQAANAGDVLILADGGVYPNSATLPVQVALTIKTADGAAAKARLVLIANTSGDYPSNMFNADASLTLMNMICDGARGTLVPTGGRFINRGTIGTGGKIHLDGVEVYKWSAVSMGGDVDSLVAENCFFSGNVEQAGGWGGTWDFQGDIVKYVKIQNNTFIMCIFGPFLGNGWGNYAPAERQIPEIIINHNTMYNITGAHGPTTMFSRAENVKFTNNLYVNGTFRPNEFFSDKYIDFPQNADDIAPFLNVISELGPKGMWLIDIEMVDSAGTVMDMQANNINWTMEVEEAWSSRGLDKPWIWTNETEAAIMDVENAYFEEHVTFVDAPETPMYAINAIADYCVDGNADTATYKGETPYQGWDWWNGPNDPTFDYREMAAVDLSYNTDATSYTAGTDGLPLGDLNWWGMASALEDEAIAVASEFDLAQNYPNPFNPSTTISFSLKKTADVSLAIYNASGQLVKTLVNGSVAAGSHSEQWDGTNEAGTQVVSGIYFYRLEADNQSQTKKMLLIK